MSRWQSVALSAVAIMLGACGGAEPTGEDTTQIEQGVRAGWSAWGAVSPGLSTTIKQAVGLDPFDSKKLLFAVGTDHTIRYSRISDTNPLQGGIWWSVPGGGTTDQPVSTAKVGNKLYVFRVNACTWHVEYQRLTAGVSGSSWDASWTAVPEAGMTSVGVAAAPLNGGLIVFSVNVINNGIYFTRFNGWAWSSLAPVPGQTPNFTPRSTVPVTAFPRGTDRVALFETHVSSQGGFWNEINVNGEWRGWQNVQGDMIPDSTVTASECATGPKGSNRFCVYHVGAADHGVYENCLRTPPGEYELFGLTWKKIPGLTALAPVTPVCDSLGGGGAQRTVLYGVEARSGVQRAATYQ
jgi:hypothetical protein